jgi:hypothetical protein
MSSDPHPDVIPELLAKEQTCSGFAPVEGGPVVEVPEIMSRPHSYANLTLMHE